MDWHSDFLTYLLLTKNLAPLTAKAYLFDAEQIVVFVAPLISNDISAIPFSRKLLRDFAAHLRLKDLSENTIERQIHGTLAFWSYCHEQGYTTRAIPFKELGLRIKSSKNPTAALTPADYKFFMEKIHDQLTRIY